MVEKTFIECQGCGGVFVGRKNDDEWQIYGTAECRQCGSTSFEPIEATGYFDLDWDE